MKYTKPPCWIECPIDVRDFLHSLPAEFEIVQPGMTQVRWPDGLTRERLEQLAVKATWASTAAPSEALNALAAIAPEEKKKRKVELWRHQNSAGIHIFAEGRKPNGREPPHLWRKVGECEVTE